MIAYFDTSAFVPLLVAEPSSVLCRRLWADADAVVTSRLLYVETAAALARGRRMARITSEQHGAALGLLNQLWWREFDIVEAAELAVIGHCSVRVPTSA
jgi:predicted nucleic acid-binding protein